jgi:hypothetical protein
LIRHPYAFCIPAPDGALTNAKASEEGAGMKSLLALVTLILAALVVEEKARQFAGDAQDAYGGAVVQAREATQTLSQKVEQQPLISLLIAGGLAYVLASVIPTRG